MVQPVTPRDRVIATVIPPGATEPVEIEGVVIAVTAMPVTYRRAPAPPAYDVLTDDRVIRPGLPAAALRRIA